MLNPISQICRRCRINFFRECDDLSDLCFKCEGFYDWLAEMKTEEAIEQEIELDD